MRLRILGQYVQASLVALSGIELAAAACALVLASMLRFQADFWTIQEHLGPLLPRVLTFGAIVLVCLFAVGLYSARQRARAFGIALRLVVAVGTATAIAAIVFYLLPGLYIGRGVFGLAAGLTIVMLATSRAAFNRVVDEDVFKRRVLVFGSGQRAASILRLRRRADRRGFVIVGYVRPEGEESAIPEALQPSPGETLIALCERLRVDEVVVAMDDRRRCFPLEQLLECRLAGYDVTELVAFLERETGRVRLDVLVPSWLIFGEGFRRDWMRLATARVMDVVASLVVLLISLPVILVTVAAIKIEDGWRAPVLYRQERVGLGGVPFKLLKFRSMRVDAERHGEALWAQQNDPRVTRVGSIIRKLRIDELPQVVNVLRGEMSCVGPRPERPQFVAQLAAKIPFYMERHCVKPGITGWAQLCYPYGSSEKDALEKLQYDLFYVKNNTLLFELSILVQTVEVVLLGKGAR